ncbi:acyl carrier protein [Dawidia soli]|uniref:Carrier domain-containing protein n=1 Tax=Dawidia soli TaxID=2782352 RepID=A0AAP2DC43_9BACT|nr:hypothetical protein [Dawidia soli]MBT1688682.1 hypothetical protein [Dawidia soli]
MGLDSVELVIRVEKYFDIAIPDKEAAEIVTVQDFADCVYTKVTLNKGDTEKIIIGIVSESSGIPVGEIKLEHRICYDLGID